MTDYHTYDDHPALGKKAPSIDSAKFLKGDKVTFQPGTTYVLVFWARFDKGTSPFTLEYLNKLRSTHSNISFIGISTDPKEEDVKAFIEKGEAKVDFPLAYDEGKKVATAFRDVLEVGALGIPWAFIIDGNGNIIWHEQFSQFTHAIDKSDFPAQLENVAAGKPLKKNGNKPVTKAAEEDADLLEGFKNILLNSKLINL